MNRLVYICLKKEDLSRLKAGRVLKRTKKGTTVFMQVGLLNPAEQKIAKLQGQISALRKVSKGEKVKKNQPCTATGRAIKRFRVKHKMSVEDLAKRVGVTHNGLLNWETGVTEPTPNNRIKLKKAMTMTGGSLI